MKDKEKQIEEMSELVFFLYENKDYTVTQFAEELYNLGYRKLTEDSVVLTETERITMSVKQWDKGYAQARKETAEKIICIIKTFSYDKEFTEIITRIISERFGVEIKE